MMHVICSKHGYRGIRANISCCQEKDKTVTPASSCSLSSTNRAENNVQTLVNFCSSKGKGQSIPHQITHVQIAMKILRPHRTVHLVHRIIMGHPIPFPPVLCYLVHRITMGTVPFPPVLCLLHVFTGNMDFLWMSTIPRVHVG